MLQYKIIPVTHYQQNCSLLWCDETREAVLVDPGGDLAQIEQVLAETDISLVKVILTHGHLDHVGATAALVQKYHIPVEGPHFVRVSRTDTDVQTNPCRWHSA